MNSVNSIYEQSGPKYHRARCALMPTQVRDIAFHPPWGGSGTSVRVSVEECHGKMVNHSLPIHDNEYNV